MHFKDPYFESCLLNTFIFVFQIQDFFWAHLTFDILFFSRGV